jgi:hypothetical protein
VRDCTFGIFFIQQSNTVTEASLTRSLPTERANTSESRKQRHQNVLTAAEVLMLFQVMLRGINAGEYT